MVARGEATSNADFKVRFELWVAVHKRESEGANLHSITYHKLGIYGKQNYKYHILLIFVKFFEEKLTINAKIV